MKDVLRESLRTVLNPKSVAVIGASENENKIGGTRGLVSALAPGLGSPAGAAWGGVESLARVDTSQCRVARVPADGRSANESRSRGSGHQTSGITHVHRGNAWTP